MFFKPMKIFKEVLLSLAEYFGTFVKFFALLSSHRWISCDHIVFFECRPELHPSSARILWFFLVPPNICAIAPHYVMMDSFQILSSSSFISFCNIQWYIIWEPLNVKQTPKTWWHPYSFFQLNLAGLYNYHTLHECYTSIPQNISLFHPSKW